MIRTIWLRIRSLGTRWEAKREIDEELRFHLERAVEENIASGMTPEEAARAARRRFGNLQNIREECRQARGTSFGESLVQDIRYGARMLRKDRGFALVAVLTLALGIGANTSMFSLLNLLLFRPGPYPHSEQLVRIFRTSPQSQTWPHSPGDLRDYREQNKSFESLAWYDCRTLNLADGGESPERVSAVFASKDLFLALDVPPLLGRVFSPEEDRPGNQVVVLGYDFWRRRFGADTNIIGRAVRLDGESVQVIGVMPAAFSCPLLWGGLDLWRPLGLAPETYHERGNHFLHAFGRLKPGVSISHAEAELKAICARLPNVGHDSLRFMPLVRSGCSEVGQRMIYFTFGLAGFVLLIACANLANLQLARAAGRWREFAVRTALGAGRARLMRQLVTESLLVSAIGGGFGLLLAVLGNGLLSRNIPYTARVDVPLDGRVLGFALLSSVLTGVAFGAAPAWLASRADVNSALKENRRGATGGRRQTALRQGLIICELALALALLAGAGLFIRRLQQLTHLDPGWRVDGLLAGDIALSSSKFDGASGWKAAEAFFQQLEERLGALPGVESVSFSWSLPIWGFGSSGNFSLVGQPPPKPGEAPLAYKEGISPAYFRTFGIELKKGRAFTAHDIAQAPPVAVINESMARRFWPGESAIGKRIVCDGEPEIIGVVNDVQFPASLGASDTPYQIYRPLSQAPGRWVSLAVRTTGASASLSSALRRAAAALDPDQAVQDLQPARQKVNQALAPVSLIGGVLAAFAALGLGLAALGIYGVIAYAATQRTGELGIRMALGAQRGQVLWLVLRQGIVLCLLGTVFGICGAFATARFLSALVPELAGSDPATFAAMTALLIFVALLASFLPARRAAQLAPMTALRYE